MLFPNEQAALKMSQSSNSLVHVHTLDDKIWKGTSPHGTTSPKNKEKRCERLPQFSSKKFIILHFDSCTNPQGGTRSCTAVLQHSTQLQHISRHTWIQLRCCCWGLRSRSRCNPSVAPAQHLQWSVWGFTNHMQEMQWGSATIFLKKWCKYLLLFKSEISVKTISHSRLNCCCKMWKRKQSPLLLHFKTQPFFEMIDFWQHNWHFRYLMQSAREKVRVTECPVLRETPENFNGFTKSSFSIHVCKHR